MQSSAHTPGSVLVIGGGVIGLTCALALQREGWQVTLTDPDRNAQAPSWGNAGHIATEQPEPLASLATLRSAPRRWYRLGGALDLRNPLSLAPWVLDYLRACAPQRFASGRQALGSLLAQALPAWQRLTEHLQAPHLLRTDGHWLCWESPASARRRLAAWHASDTGTAHFQPLPGQHLDALGAHLAARPTAGIAFSGTAQIADPHALAAALQARFQADGGQRLHHTIQALVDAGRGQVDALDAAGQRLSAQRIVVCAGVGSRPLMASLGIHAPLVAERGYHLHWRQHDWPDLPPVVFEDRSMILTRFSGGLRAASFVEYARPDTAPDPGKWRRLQQHVTELGIPVHGQPQPWFGARPTLPDYLPAIGRSQRWPQVYYAFGHQHLGLTLAAVTAEWMATQFQAPQRAAALHPFDLSRFTRTP